MSLAGAWRAPTDECDDQKKRSRRSEMLPPLLTWPEKNLRSHAKRSDYLLQSTVKPLIVIVQLYAQRHYPKRRGASSLRLGTMDPASLQKVKGQMHSFAMGEAMAQAARDYQKVGYVRMIWYWLAWTAAAMDPASAAWPTHSGHSPRPRTLPRLLRSAGDPSTRGSIRRCRTCISCRGHAGRPRARETACRAPGRAQGRG